MINAFYDDYFFLSNFYPAGIEIDGEYYRTSEHAYQAFKTEDPMWRTIIQNCATPGQAKRVGKKVPMRDNWEFIKYGVMRKVVLAKFEQHVDLRKKLLYTDNIHLEEGNTWGDTVWGTVDGKGQNLLGIVLMEIREILRQRDGAVATHWAHNPEIGGSTPSPATKFTASDGQT